MTGDVVTKFTAETGDFEGGTKRMVSGVDTLADSSKRLKDALSATSAASHDVDALFKQITKSCKTMGDATVFLNQAFREGITPVSDLNALSQRLQGHFAGLAAVTKEAGAGIKEVGAAGAGLAAVNDNAARAAAAMGHVGHMSVGAKREIIVLAHEAMSGNFSRMPGSLMVLAERFGNVGMAAMRVVAPLAAAGWVAYEIAAHNEHAAQALAKTETALWLTGQAGLFTRQGLEATTSALAHMHGISKQMAGEVVTEFGRIRSVTPQIMADMTRGMEGWVMITGQEAPAAARALAQAMADPEKFLQLLEKETHGVSAATMEMVARLVDANDVMQAKAVAAREFGEVMERAAAKMKTPFQQATQEAANALADLAHAFAGSGEKGEGLAASMRTLAEVIRGLELPIAVIGKALRDLLDSITVVVQAFMAGFASMKAVADVAAVATVEFARVVHQAVTGDLSQAQKVALDMPRKLAEEWGVRTAEVKRHLDEMRAAMRDISEPYLPGHQDGKPQAQGGNKPELKATGTGASESDREKLALEALNRNLTIRRELRQIDGDRKVLTEQLAVLEGRMAGAAGDSKAGLSAQVSDIKAALQELDERYEKLTKKDGGETKMEGFRRELAELQAADKRSLEERKADDLKFWQAKQANLEKGGKDFAQVTIEIRRLEKAIAADAHNERLADLERQRAAAHKGSEERITLARREAEEVKRYAGEHSKAYQDSLKRIEEMVKEHQRELDRIEAEGLESRASAKKADLETDAENLRFLRGLGVIDEHEKLARLRQIKADEYQIERDALEQKLKLKSLEAAEKDRINKQIQQLDQGHRAQDLAATHQQTLAVLHDWQTTSSGIGSAFGGAIKGMIVQGQTFQQAERNLALGLGNVFADLALRKIGTWIWSEGVMRAWSKITGQQEVVDAAAKETAKTAATTAGQAARTSATVAGSAARNAAGATEHSSLLSMIGEMVAGWFGFEAAKTGETVAGAAAREGVETASTIASIAAAKAEAAGEIPSYAAIGAAAAMASVAAIPFIGWAMAPEVGAEHFAMAMSFLAPASAEGGEENVPFDGAPYILHKNEKVLPAPFSRRLDQLMNNVEMMQKPGAMALPSPGPLVLPMPSSAGARPVPVAARMADALRDGGRDGDIHIHAVDAASINNMMRRPGIARNTVDVMRSQAGQGNYIKKGK